VTRLHDAAAVEITPAIPGGRQVIGGYGPRMFRVSGTVYETSILVFIDRTIAWPVTGIQDLTPEIFVPVLAEDPPIEVLLLGLGARNLPVPAALRNALRGAGVSMDAMDSGAACRTYNVLMAEDRRVAAALIAID